MNVEKEQEKSAEDKGTETLRQFGALLKEERENKGLTIQSVATSLRLNSDLIQALEKNDAASLPSKIFVMGYLRSYARLLNVDESNLEQLDLSAIHQTVDVKASYSSRPEKNSKHPSIRFMTYLVIGGMVILLALWWLSMQTNLSDISSLGNYQQEDSSAGTTLALPENGSEPAWQDEAASEPEVMTPVESVTPKKPDAVKEQVEMVVAEQAEQATEESPVDRAELSVESNGSVVVAEPIAQSELKLTYLEDSWTEVSDATDSRLLYGLYKQGREVTLQGVAPFALFFGYAPGVVVTHNEEQFDHASFQRNGVARFSVGSAEDNHLPGAN